jgi:hypothetical protein
MCSFSVVPRIGWYQSRYVCEIHGKDGVSGCGADLARLSATTTVGGHEGVDDAID